VDTHGAHSKTSVSLGEKFEKLGEAEKERVLGELPDVFAGVQESELPARVDAYGGNDDYGLGGRGRL